MSAYRLSGRAESDLRAVFWEGLERFGPRQTERYLEELEGQFDRIAQYPETARLRPEVLPPVRVLAHRAHVIVYDIEDELVVILRIRHGRENWAADPIGDQP